MLVGAVTGILTGAGIGGGTLLLLWLTGVAGIRQQTAQAINLCYFIAAAPPAIVSHWRLGLIEEKALLPAILPGCACCLLGGWLASRVSTELLRRAFGLLLLVVAWRSFRGERPAQRGKDASR